MLMLTLCSFLMLVPNDKDLFRRGLRVKPSADLVAQMVKSPPAMWETWVWSLG